MRLKADIGQTSLTYDIKIKKTKVIKSESKTAAELNKSGKTVLKLVESIFKMTMTLDVRSNCNEGRGSSCHSWGSGSVVSSSQCVTGRRQGI